MIKNIILPIFIFIAVSAFSQQKNINNYKYVIVPSQFEWLNKPDQFQVNSLTKFLLKKQGFTVFLSDEKIPTDLASNRCLALTANVKKTSGMFTIKNIIELRDCTNNVLFTSIEGRSKQKDYQKGYHESIRKAFASIKKLNYHYTPIKEEVVVEEVTPVVVNPGVTVVKEKEIIETPKPAIKKAENTLYAQEITNGFQLVNTKPEMVFQILKSSKKEFFYIKNKDGVLFKNGNNWIAEYYEKGQLVQKKYQIKF